MLNLDLIIDFDKISTRNTFNTDVVDWKVIDERLYTVAKELLKDKIEDEIVVDLGCGSKGIWMDKAVSELGGHYVGVDLQDFSHLPFQGNFVQADMYSFIDALHEKKSVHYIVNSIDFYVVHTKEATDELVSRLVNTTKNYVLCLTDDIVRKHLRGRNDFSITPHEFSVTMIDNLDDHYATEIVKPLLFSR